MRKLKIHCLPHLSAPSGEMARRFLHDLREAFAAGPARRFARIFIQISSREISSNARRRARLISWSSDRIWSQRWCLCPLTVLPS
jgi:hypothetical protein